MIFGKNEIRAAMKARRNALTPEERKAASEIVCAKLAADSEISLRDDPFEWGSLVAVYLASPQEIDLSPFIRKMLESGVKVVAPRWNGETYELAVLKGLDDEHLRKGPMGILYFYVDCMYVNSETSDSEYHAFREKLKAASETSRVKVHLRYRDGKLRNFDIKPEDLAAETGCELCLKLEVLGGGIDDRSECDRVKHVERSR